MMSPCPSFLIFVPFINRLTAFVYQKELLACLLDFIGSCCVAQSGLALTILPHPPEYRVIGIGHHAQLKTVHVCKGSECC